MVLPGDMFDYFVIHATEVVPNIKIDKDTGTSKEGLRYSEYLPAETVLYSLISFDRCFASDASTEFDNEINVKEFFIEKKPKDIVQVGGDETKGKGFVKINFVTEKENG